MERRAIRHGSQGGKSRDGTARTRTGHLVQPRDGGGGADRMLLTICSILTPQDSKLAICSNGSSESKQFHQHHFAQVMEPLRQEIERITDISGLKSSVDVDETTGSVAYSFTT